MSLSPHQPDIDAIESLRWAALACDYDGTLASSGRVRPKTLEALAQVQHSRRKLVLVTGRELDDLFSIFPMVPLFDRVVAENGAVLYDPATGEHRLLADRPPREFLAALHERELEPLSVGHAIVATLRGQRRTVSKVIRDLRLPLTLILNKPVMVLPQGVNKATGLMAALHDIGVAPEETVGIGDAENDVDFLTLCGYSAAVANALPVLKQKVDMVTSRRHGEGVIELVNTLLKRKWTYLVTSAAQSRPKPYIGHHRFASSYSNLNASMGSSCAALRAG